MSSEDVAIIGMSGRFPGAKNIDQLWENLCLGKESITTLTDDELREKGVPEKLLQNPSYIKSGFFLDRIDLFDADFFDISPREAVAMDPQHRFFLECAWEALEDGGYPPGIEPLNVGVFGGLGPATASYLMEYAKAHPEIQGFSANYHTYGVDKDYFTTRTSYKLNLTGPSFDVQTACSTSLVAVHLACEAIRRNHCSLALAGGVSIRIPHGRGYLHSEGHIYSSDGHCRTFDANSSGTVFGNGVGIVLLKSLEKAVADGDRIYAVIKGSCINNDGGSKSNYAAPSSKGQMDCILRGLSSSGIDPKTIQLVEAHGTGTVVGDPIEIQSLSQAFGAAPKGQCVIGSIKPNVGHLGGASGVASLIKLALCLFYKKFPAHINFKDPNPLIKFPETPFYVNTETREWPVAKTPRRGAINSFGVGGTNAFAVLEEAPQNTVDRPLQTTSRLSFPLSAKTKPALEARVAQLTTYLIEHPHVALCDVAYTLNCRRKHFSHRLFFEASSREELIEALSKPSSHIPESAKNLEFEGKIISLPTYPFQGQSYWVNVPAEPLHNPSMVHPLLGWKLDASLVSEEQLYENIFNLNELNYLKDHKIFNRILFPFTGFLEIFCAAANAVGLCLPLQLSHVEIKYALELGDRTHIQTKIKETEGEFHLSIYSRDKRGWHLHATAVATGLTAEKAPIKCSSSDAFQSASDFYTTVAEKGYQYGPHFKTFTGCITSDQSLLGQFKTDGSTGSYTIYPPLLDGVFQLNILARIKNNISGLEGTLALPVSVQRVQIFEPLSNQIHASIDMAKVIEGAPTDFSIYTASGQLIMKLEKLDRKFVDKEALFDRLDRYKVDDRLLYHELWDLSNPIQSGSFQLNGTKRWVFMSASPEAPLFKKIKEAFSKQSIEIVPNLNALQNPANIQGIVNFLSLEESERAFQLNVAFLQTYITTFGPISIPCFSLTRGLYTHRPSVHPLAPFVGLQRALRAEFPDRSFIHIDIDPSLGEEAVFEALMLELTASDFEPEISLREEGRFVNRVITHEEYIKRNQYLDIPLSTSYFLEKGSKIEDLSFKPKQKQFLRDDELEIAVQAVALNFRDVLNSMGLYPGQSAPLGSDFCGKIKRKGKGVSHLEVGQTVFGLSSGAFQNRLIAPSSSLIAKPNNLTVNEAASIPIVFLTTYYALIKLANLKKEDKILIHCATGGIGLAAIQIAKQVGAEIFATVSSPRKKAYLQSLGVTHIYSSRSLDFVEELKNSQITVVLNSLTGSGFIEGALSLCAPNGCFLELSKRNIWTESQVAQMRPDIRYFIVALDELRKNEPQKIQDLLAEISLLFEKKLSMALPQRVFSLGQVKPAFQYLQQAKQIGKVVVRFPNQWKENLSQATYLITGGLGGLGIVTAEWLIGQGVKHLVLVGRTASKNLNSKLDNYRKNGVEILVKACDVTNEEELEALFKELNQTRAMKGIIHAAGILHNASFLQHSWGDFERVLAPKIQGSLLLHDQIIKHQLDLDFIVYFSSISSVLGAYGRASYAAGNSFLDYFSQHQQQMGIPAISINWGAWGETGMALPHLRQMQTRGHHGIANEDAMRYLEAALNAQNSNVAVADINWDRFIAASPSKNPRLSLLHKAEKSLKNSKQIETNLASTQDLLAAAMRRVLGQPNDYPIKIEEPFIQQQLDSLNQIEFLAEIERSLKPAQPIRTHVLQEYPTVVSLAQYLDNNLSKKPIKPYCFVENFEEAPTFSKLPLNKQKWSPLPENMKYFWYINFSNDFNIGYVVRFHKPVDPKLLEKIFNHVLRHHPIFYLVISSWTPSYKVAPFEKTQLRFIDLSERQEIENHLSSEYKKELERAFQPQEFPKLRSSLYKINEAEYELQIICAHSISDGRALHLFLKAVDEAYTDLIERRPLSLYSAEKDFLVQYPKYDAVVSQDIAKKTAFIKNYYNNYRPFIYSHSHPAQPPCSPIFLKYGADFRLEFQTVCQQIGIEQSLALTGLAALALSLIAKQMQFSVGYASNGVFTADFHQVMGPSAKELPLNITRNSQDTLQTYLDRLKESQTLWSYLREFPSFLLKSPYASFNKIANVLEKMTQWHCLPTMALPLLLTKKESLAKFLPKKKAPENTLLKLSVNEIELKDFSNFSAYQRNFLLHRAQGAKVKVLSLLINKEWFIYLSLPTDAKTQELMLECLESLIEHFVSDRSVRVEEVESARLTNSSNLPGGNSFT